MNSDFVHSPGSLPEERGQKASFVPWAMWSLLGMVILSVVGVFAVTVLHPSRQPPPVYGEVPDFTLTNQFGRAFTRADLKGHVWIAAIIFTRCPGPCLAMSGRMKSIQNQLPAGGAIRLLSLTADPDFDTPAVLNAYAARFNAGPGDWQFLTGPKEAVYRLATEGLKLAAQENEEAKSISDQFIHSTRMVLIDARGQLRGVSFEGTEAGTVPEILSAARRLAKER